MRARAGSGGPATARPTFNRVCQALAGLCLIVTVACVPIYRNHGYAPTEIELATLTVGKDTRETVLELVGRPAAEDLLNDTSWFYVQSRWQQIGPRAPEEIERQVVVISFNEAGVLQNIERFGLEDGQVVALSRRVTETNIHGVTLMQQLFGSLGRISGEQLLQE